MGLMINLFKIITHKHASIKELHAIYLRLFRLSNRHYIQDSFNLKIVYYSLRF